MGKFIDLTGQKFGRLTVIKRLLNNKYHCAMWECKCDCDNIVKISSNSLRSKNTKSCGCLQKERAKQTGFKNKRNIPNKIRNTLYRMKTRCYNCKSSKYKYYGGRGIKICSEWLDKENGMMSFYNWAIQNNYKDGLTIDRIDVNGNYEPNNCRWVTMKEQANNKRNTRFITYNGECHTITDWAKNTGIPLSILRDRANRKWSVERIFNQTIRKRGKQC